MHPFGHFSFRIVKPNLNFVRKQVRCRQVNDEISETERGLHDDVSSWRARVSPSPELQTDTRHSSRRGIELYQDPDITNRVPHAPTLAISRSRTEFD